MIRQPPPTRVALGYAMLNGQRVEVYMSPEWDRYFQSLTVQVNDTASSVVSITTTIATGLIADSAEGGGGDTEFIPGPKGDQGEQGQPGPAIYIMQEEAETDVFWPVKNT